jgi:hypothetical protein
MDQGTEIGRTMKEKQGEGDGEAALQVQEKEYEQSSEGKRQYKCLDYVFSTAQSRWKGSLIRGSRKSSWNWLMEMN